MSSNKQTAHRPVTQAKVQSSSTKPMILSSFSRSKPSIQHSQMTISYSSSSLSSSIITDKHRTSRISPTKSKSTFENQLITTGNDEENLPVNDEYIPSTESVQIDIIDEENNLNQHEQTFMEEQEYQRKLNQKIREAQQLLEIKRQNEEERQRQLEFEEKEREEEQIRLVEEQRRVEQERLQRAIEECERENELKRQEEQRLQQQREEIERKHAEETERLNRERQEKTKKEEEERNERKKRLDLIMRRTRQTSPISKVSSFCKNRLS